MMPITVVVYYGPHGTAYSKRNPWHIPGVIGKSIVGVIKRVVVGIIGIDGRTVNDRWVVSGHVNDLRIGRLYFYDSIGNHSDLLLNNLLHDHIGDSNGLLGSRLKGASLVGFFPQVLDGNHDVFFLR
jgi:hypothetical protein